MMIHPRVEWREGLLLSPGHFEQTEAHNASRAYALYSKVQPINWGLFSLALDKDLLEKGTLGITRVSGLTKSGKLFDLFESPEFSSLPPARDIEEIVAKNSDASGYVDVFLGIPAHQAHGSATIAVDNGSTDGQDHVGIHLPGFLICGADEIQTLPCSHAIKVVRLSTRGKTASVVDSYVPPCLDINFLDLENVTGYLPALLADVLTLLKGRRDALRAIVRGAEEPDPGVQVLHASYHWPVLSTLNEAIALLQHLQSLPVLHPETLFRSFVKILGRLATFAPDDQEVLNQIPVYDHDQLHVSFDAARGLFGQLLEAREIRSDRVVAIPLSQVTVENQVVLMADLKNQLGDQFGEKLNVAEIYFRYPVQAVSTAEIRGKWSITSLEMIEKVLAYATQTSISVVEREGLMLPNVAHEDTLSFLQLKKEGSNWDAIIKSGQLALYSPDQEPLKQLEANIYAVFEDVVAS